MAENFEYQESRYKLVFSLTVMSLMLWKIVCFSAMAEDHHHKAYHDGRLYEIGACENGHLEVRLQDGRLEVWFVGGGHDTNRSMPVETHEIVFMMETGGVTDKKVTLRADPIVLAGEKTGRCSHFIADDPWLKEVTNFKARADIFFKGSHHPLLIEYSSNRVSENEKKKLVIKDEAGPEGHTTIGIDEQSLDLGKYKKYPVTFGTLMQWTYDSKNQAPVPDSIISLHEKVIQITGFMYPLQEGKDISFFCLLRSTQTCCYGPRPQYNQYIFVEMAHKTPFERISPVSCEGRLFIEPNLEEGYIYRMEGLQCHVVK